MSDAKPEAKKSKFGTLKDVIFVYTSTTWKNEQLNEEKKPPLSDSPDEFHAYEVKILLSASRFEDLKDEYGDSVKNFPHAKRVKPQECVERFKIDLPAENMYLIKFSQNVLTGKAIPDPLNPGKTTRKESRPIQLYGIRGKVQDRKGNTINEDTGIGHGTKGHFQFNPVESKHGTYMYPVAIIVSDLVERASGGGGIDDEAIDWEELEEVDPEELDTSCQLSDEEEPPEVFD